MLTYGYVCESSACDLRTLREQVSPCDRLFHDDTSHFLKRFANRPAARHLMGLLTPGDTVRLHSATFASIQEMFAVLRSFVDAGAEFSVVDFGPQIGLPDGLDSRTKTGKAISHIGGFMAQIDSACRAERTRLSYRSGQRNSKQPNQFPGYGFKWGGRGHRIRVSDPEERCAMAYFVERRQDGWSWRQIYVDLWTRHVKTRDSREWSYWRIIRAYHREMQLRALEVQR